MTRKERMLAFFNDQPVDHAPHCVFAHVPEDRRFGQAGAEAQMEFHRESANSFLKIIVDLRFVVDGPLQTPQDWKSFKGFDPNEKYFQTNLDLLKRILDLNQGEDLVYWTLFTPWNHARAMTKDDAIVNAHTYSRDPAFEDALKRLEDAVIRQADIFFSEGVDGMYYAARGGELNRFEDDLFQRYVKQYDLGVLKYINTRSKINIFHMCGDNLRMDQYRDYECAAINWDVHGNNLSLQQGRAMFGKKVMGGLDNLAAISNGTPEETAQETLAVLESYGKQGLIVGGDCTLAAYAPMDNIKAMAKVCDTY